MDTLPTSWARAWRGLAARGLGEDLRDAVLARYAEPHRRYHTIQHLAECLALFESVRQASVHPAEVEMALWFHDAVYDLHGSDNEGRSAEWAQAALREAGVAADVAARVCALVLFTRHSAVPGTIDGKLLVDIDLAILGASATRFAEYENQIREEYSHVADSLFRQKRREILQSFLARPVIYSTPLLCQRLESTARANLASAVANLA